MAPEHPVTRRLDLTRPVRCATCGQKFTRTHGRQKHCTRCQPGWVRTQSAARAAARPARREARQRQARRDDLAWRAILAARCPHGDKLGDCPELWCASRREDWERHDYPVPPDTPGEPL
jgi:hypothetical protein